MFFLAAVPAIASTQAGVNSSSWRSLMDELAVQLRYRRSLPSASFRVNAFSAPDMILN